MNTSVGGMNTSVGGMKIAVVGLALGEADGLADGLADGETLGVALPLASAVWVCCTTAVANRSGVPEGAAVGGALVAEGSTGGAVGVSTATLVGSPSLENSTTALTR
jgi:hypothetical protein